MLDDLDLPFGDPQSAPGSKMHKGTFSLVTEPLEEKVRALPTFFHGGARLFGDRDIAKVKARLVKTVRIVLESHRVATYLVTAVRLVGGHYGLYSRDLFNRNPYRLKLARQGVEFAQEAYVTLGADGTWRSQEWGAIVPKFVVSGGGDALEPTKVIRKTGGLVPFTFAVLRVGDLDTEELQALISFFRSVDVLACEDPAAMAQVLQETVA